MPQPDSSCDSSTATTIVRGLCMGKGACNVTVDATRAYHWTVDTQWQTYCTASASAAGRADSMDANCTASFSDSGGLSSCGTRSLRLIAMARCMDVEVTALGVTYSKTSLRLLLVWLEVATCTIFLLGAYWLRMQQRAEAGIIDRRVITVDDYSVMVTSLPPHSSISELHKQLKTHFETLLSAVPPTLESFRDISRKAAQQVQVAVVYFGYSSAEMLRRLTKRGALVRKLERGRVQLKKLRRLHAPAGELRALRSANKDLRGELRQYDAVLKEWKEAETKKVQVGGRRRTPGAAEAETG